MKEQCMRRSFERGHMWKCALAGGHSGPHYMRPPGDDPRTMALNADRARRAEALTWALTWAVGTIVLLGLAIVLVGLQ